jgi:asparaginyl-tRNA synthetase
MGNSYIFLSQIDKHVSETVVLKGWLYNLRSSGKISFLQFRDGTGVIQAVALSNSISAKAWQIIQSLTLESSVDLIGKVKKDKRSPTGYELELKEIKLIQLAHEDYPIGKKAHGTGFLMDLRHLWLRSPKERALLIVRHEIIKAITKFYDDNNFTKIDTPIFSPVACEGTTTLFEVDYFGETAYLSQSGQLYLEACLPSFNRVYDFQPVFRAEKSKTRRHLTEFWMNNAEAAFVDHDQNLKIQEQLVSSVLQHVLVQCQTEFAILERDTRPLEGIITPFIRLTHQEAVKRLSKLGSSIKPTEDLGAEDEKLLMDNFNQPVFVEYYPASVKAFYMKRWDKDPSRAKCADLLAPDGRGEIIGGSERETDYDVLLESMKLHKLPIGEYQWYLDQRKYGSVTHSGFGVGLERLVAWITGIHHIRRTTAFPRTIKRLRP